MVKPEKPGKPAHAGKPDSPGKSEEPKKQGKKDKVVELAATLLAGRATGVSHAVTMAQELLAAVEALEKEEEPKDV